MTEQRHNRPETTPRPRLDMSEFDLPRGAYATPGQGGEFPLYAYTIEPDSIDFLDVGESDQ